MWLWPTNVQVAVAVAEAQRQHVTHTPRVTPPRRIKTRFHFHQVFEVHTAMHLIRSIGGGWVVEGEKGGKRGSTTGSGSTTLGCQWRLSAFKWLFRSFCFATHFYRQLRMHTDNTLD